MSDESTGWSTASSLVQSLSREVRKRQTTGEACVCVWGGPEVWIIITTKQKALDLVWCLFAGSYELEI